MKWWGDEEGWQTVCGEPITAADLKEKLTPLFVSSLAWFGQFVAPVFTSPELSCSIKISTSFPWTFLMLISSWNKPHCPATSRFFQSGNNVTEDSTRAAHKPFPIQPSGWHYRGPWAHTSMLESGLSSAELSSPPHTPHFSEKWQDNGKKVEFLHGWTLEFDALLVQ